MFGHQPVSGTCVTAFTHQRTCLAVLEERRPRPLRMIQTKNLVSAVTFALVQSLQGTHLHRRQAQILVDIEVGCL